MADEPEVPPEEAPEPPKEKIKAELIEMPPPEPEPSDGQ